MRLHEDKRLFRQAIQFTSDQMQIQPIYVEKDYWVTLALFTLFSHDIGKETVFKGGTSQNFTDKTYLRLSDKEVIKHLHLKQLLGLYPLLANKTSWFLVADFDE